jgi:hypothetical protein
MAHLSDDEPVAKMGHPIVVVRLDMWATHPNHRFEDGEERSTLRVTSS